MRPISVFTAPFAPPAFTVLAPAGGGEFEGTVMPALPWVLDEIGAKGVTRLLVFNKNNHGGDEAALRAKHPGCIVMSARREGDFAKLHEAIVEYFRRNLVEAELFLPWAVQGLRGEIFAACEVLGEHTDGEGTFLRVRGEPEALKRLREQLASTIALR